MLNTLAVVALFAFQPVEKSQADIDMDWKLAEAWAEEHPLSYLRVEFSTLGGPLPFMLESDSVLNSDDEVLNWKDQHGYSAHILNGDERIGARIKVQGGGYAGSARAEINFQQFDSIIEAVGTGSCTTPSILPRHHLRWGTWTKKRGETDAVVNLTAKPVDSPDDRFDILEDAGKSAAFTGRWSVDFNSSDDLAVGTFTVDDYQLASGTFLTTTGDYRYLAGRVDGNLMRLSTFDGAHAFLFHARMLDDGSIEGDFWSGNWYHETWTAVRDNDAKLPDAFEQTVITDEAALGEMVFKGLDSTPTRVLDLLDQSGAKARVIEVFGSWCPNCGDAGRELVSLKEKYGDDLGIVGLAFELTDDFDRSVTQVKRHHEHIGSDWPILIAGLNDKEEATKTLAVLDKVRSYPTLIFLNQANEVAGVYTGFSGPATGDAYTEQRLRFEALIEGLIEE
jgi:thiol-disulfide isomerase/thioredoxin